MQKAREKVFCENDIGYIHVKQKVKWLYHMLVLFIYLSIFPSKFSAPFKFKSWSSADPCHIQLDLVLLLHIFKL